MNPSSGSSPFCASLQTHIRLLLAGLTKKTIKPVGNELLQVAEAFGPDGYIFLFRGVLEGADLRANVSHDTPKLLLLGAFVERMSERPAFPTLLARALSTSSPVYPGGREALLPCLSRALQLSLHVQLAMAISLADVS